MTEDNIRKTIGVNITANRKRLGITQSGLAEKINYSDKSISKWERGEGIPDILTLMKLSEIFGVSVDQLLHPPEERADEPRKQAVSTKSRVGFKRYFITTLSIVGVWAVTTLIVFMFRFVSSSVADVWNVRVVCFGLTASFIVLLVMSCLWLRKLWVCIACSGLVWSIALTLCVTFKSIRSDWEIYALAAVLQLAVIVCYVWYVAAKRRKSE